MIKAFTILMLFFISSVYADLPIIGEKKICTINDTEQVIPLSAPCSWAVNSDGSLQVHNVNNKSIAIIVGKPIDQKIETEWEVTKDDLCSFESVGVELDDMQRPIRFSKPMKEALLCSKIQIDQVFFMSYQW